ncbi:major facilitator superfamily domain-containing protein 5-like [Hyaloraphidium curvatum]|nr:major facilitator superfamily domain-containing protein 5-like [Hyaloraphidium curvatum]
MQPFYYLLFGALAAVCVYLEVQKSRGETSAVTSEAYRTFRNNYVVVYALMMAGDWLQGPYVYALYQHYGYTTGDIGKLFIAGFGSSMVFGTIVGSLGDRFGRRTASITYCVTYILSCFTKHSPAYSVLMVGRLLGGIATSLLFSAFESWLVAEHFKRGFDAQWLSLTFSRAIFVGNGLVAILAGLLANFLVKNMELGPVVPFDAAAAFLSVGFAIIVTTWPENYGDASEKAAFSAQFVKAWQTIKGDQRIASLGAIQSLFEGSMYTFVFLWTPALSPKGESIPHGFIFALFMLACMIGSSVAARLLLKIEDVPVESYMRYVFGCASLSLFVPVALRFMGMNDVADPAGGLTLAGQILLLAFLCFEGCVGVFWPSIMKMRSTYIPEESRSTIMNFFRIPLNLFVCVVLYNVSAFEISTMFTMCAAFLGVAAALQHRLLGLSKNPQPRRSIADDSEASQKLTDTDELGRPKEEKEAGESA